MMNGLMLAIFNQDLLSKLTQFHFRLFKRLPEIESSMINIEFIFNIILLLKFFYTIADNL